MTPEQREIMEKLDKGMELSVQENGLDICRAIFADQTEVSAELYDSLDAAGWLRLRPGDGTCFSVGLSTLGKAAIHIELKYMSGTPEEAASKFRGDMLFVLLKCQEAAPDRGKYPVDDSDSGAVLVNAILDVIAPLPEKPTRPAPKDEATFKLPD